MEKRLQSAGSRVSLSGASVQMSAGSLCCGSTEEGTTWHGRLGNTGGWLNEFGSAQSFIFSPNIILK